MKSLTSILISTLLASHLANAIALPTSTTTTIHSVITRTSYIPAITSAAGSNPYNAATPALFSDNTTSITLSSFSDASPSRMTTVTVTESIRIPVLITVTDYHCPTFSSETAGKTSTASTITWSISESTARSTSSGKASKAQVTPASSKACIFPIPGECDG